MGKRKERSANPKKEAPPAWKLAYQEIDSGPLYRLAYEVVVYCSNDYPIAKNDWAYVSNDGHIYLNPHREEATVSEWEYIISHCLLHLGFGHFQKDRLQDPAWVSACDLVVAKFLKDSHIGTPPPEYQRELPFPVKDEEQTWQRLAESPIPCGVFSTMSSGRADMVWKETKDTTDYVELFAKSLQCSIRDTLRTAKGLPLERSYFRDRAEYMEARDWFLSSFPLLGAVASSFRIVDDRETVQRMDIPVAAISPQMSEIYINPRCRLNRDEWKFVLAHEFLHAALRHDVRCEDRNPELWNVACDYVVNGWLVEMGVGAIPEFAPFDEMFRGLSVETVYDAICEDIRRYRAESAGDILYGDEAWWSSLDGSEVDALYRSALQQGLAYHQEQRRGYLPAGLVEEIYALSRPPIRWDVELAKWFDEQFAPLDKHRSYARLSRRQSSTPDIPRPAWRMEEQAVEQRIFGVLLDTSGSMERSLLAAALGTIASYSEARDVHRVRVVFCDAAAYDQGIMAPEEIAGAVKVRGRGGTKLQPGIDLLEKDKRFPKEAPLLIITDGACDRLNLRGRKHAYLMPWGSRLPFVPKAPVFRLK